MEPNPAQSASTQPSAGYGKLFLHDQDLPALACSLTELKPEMCRGLVPLLELNPETLLAWQQKLMPRQKLRLRLEFMRGLPGLELEGLIQSVTPVQSGVEIELNIVVSGSGRQAILNAAEANGDEPETLQPVELPGTHGSSVMTLTPLSADEVEALQRTFAPPAQLAVEAAGADTAAQAERPANAQNNFMAIDRPAGRAAIDAGRADNAAHGPSSIAFDARDATVAFERPANLRQPSTKAMREPPQPPAPAEPPSAPPPPPDATVGIQRPLTPGSTADMPRIEATKAVLQHSAVPPQVSPIVDASVSPPVFDGAATLPADSTAPSVATGDETIQVERRAGQRESGQMTVSLGPTAAPGAPTATKRLGEVLIQMGKLTAEQVEEVLRLSLESGQRIGRCLLAWELVPPDVLCRALSIQSGLPMTVLEGDAIPEKLNKIFPLPMMMRHSFVPFDDAAAVLCVAACNPLDAETLKELERISRKVIEVFLAREDQVARQLDWMRVKMKTRSRRSLRYKMSLALMYQFCSRLGVRSDKEVHQGTTVNISEGGMLIDSAQAPGDPGAMLQNGLYVNVCLKPAIGEIWAICDVREIRLLPDTVPPRWLLGLEIVDINEESRARLRELFSTAKSAKMVKTSLQ